MDDAQLDAGFVAMAGQIAPRQNQGLVIRFFMEPIEDAEKTKQAGHPIYVDEEYVEIRIVGDLDMHRHPVTDADRARFPAEYEAFKKGQPQETVSGTPLTKWPGLPSLSHAKNAAFYGIHTVEQLSDVNDGNLQRLGPGWIAIRQKARDYLASAKDSAHLFRLRTENEELKARVATLEQIMVKQSQDIEAARQNGGALPAVPAGPDPRMAALEAQIAALAAAVAQPAAPKRRGRPPKNGAAPVPE